MTARVCIDREEESADYTDYTDKINGKGVLMSYSYCADVPNLRNLCNLRIRFSIIARFPRRWQTSPTSNPIVLATK